MMRITLTAEQHAAIEPHVRPDRTLLAKIDREWFDGSTAATAGRLILEIGSVPTSSLPALRAAIRSSTSPQKPTRTRRKAHTPNP